MEEGNKYTKRKGNTLCFQELLLRIGKSFHHQYLLGFSLFQISGNTIYPEMFWSWGKKGVKTPILLKIWILNGKAMLTLNAYSYEIKSLHNEDFVREVVQIFFTFLVVFYY